MTVPKTTQEILAGQGAFKAAQRPSVFESHPTDVRIVSARRVLTCHSNAKYTTIQGGIQISNKETTTKNADGSSTEALALGTVACIVRNVRPVKIAWARHQGPAYLAHIAGHSPAIPHEVKGVTRRVLLTKMREVPSMHGSNPLKRVLAEYGDDDLAMLTFEGCDSVAECIARLQQREAPCERLASQG